MQTDEEKDGHNMKRWHLAWLLALTLACGCTRESPEYKALNGKIAEIAASTLDGKQRYKSLDNLNEFLAELRKCKDEVLQSEMAREFAERMANACPRLENSDYSQFVVIVRRFGLNVGYVVTVLEEFEPEAELRLRYYSTLMGMYKRLCFSIPRTAKGANEDEMMFELRVNSARVLSDEYAESAASWKRFAFPRIKAKLPPGMRDEFDKECAALLDLPANGKRRDEDFRK